jgi:prepilin-type N-terminal cleavage/methylation domain-containing protein
MKKNKGFTLIELMVVVVILGILAVVVAPRIPDMVRKANEGATKGSLSTLRSTLNIYYSDVEGYYPLTASDVVVTTTFESALIPKYIKKLPVAKIPTAHTGNLSGVYGYASIGSAPTLSNDGTNAWGYCGTSTASDYGSIIVNCSHTDTASTTWYSY